MYWVLFFLNLSVSVLVNLLKVRIVLRIVWKHFCHGILAIFKKSMDKCNVCHDISVISFETEFNAIGKIILLFISVLSFVYLYNGTQEMYVKPKLVMPIAPIVALR